MADDNEDLGRLLREMQAKLTALRAVEWNNQTGVPGLLGAGMAGPPGGVDSTTWDDGQTRWDAQWDVATALNYPAPVRRRLEPARWYDTRFYAWRELRDRVIARAGIRCDWCGYEAAVDARPIEYAQSCGRWDYYQGGKAYLFVGLCGECTVKHDLENDGGLV